VLHFGAVQGARVEQEQVKGITHSLDALLGVERRKPTNKTTTVPFPTWEMGIVDDREFANVNGIEYSLSQLIGTSATTTPVSPAGSEGEEDESAPEFPTDP
jgi:phosphatidylserine decarboxylase